MPPRRDAVRSRRVFSCPPRRTQSDRVAFLIRRAGRSPMRCVSHAARRTQSIALRFSSAAPDAVRSRCASHPAAPDAVRSRRVSHPPRRTQSDRVAFLVAATRGRSPVRVAILTPPRGTRVRSLQKIIQKVDCVLAAVPGTRSPRHWRILYPFRHFDALLIESSQAGSSRYGSAHSFPPLSK
jgi:hypothetical protein